MQKLSLYSPGMIIYGIEIAAPDALIMA